MTLPELELFTQLLVQDVVKLEMEVAALRTGRDPEALTEEALMAAVTRTVQALQIRMEAHRRMQRSPKGFASLTDRLPHASPDAAPNADDEA